VLVIEREKKTGGILNQCIHNGFGLHRFGQELTGPEYAQKFVDMVAAEDIDVMTDSTVLKISAAGAVCATGERAGGAAEKAGEQAGGIVTVIGGGGTEEIGAGAIVLCSGCRERGAGAINLSGSRPAGIYAAGTAQKLINIDGLMVGKKIVILGSGDIGLIMARRMTLEGAKVLAVLELMPYSSGLKRNVVQCLNDFDIPLFYNTTVTRVVGKKRVDGIFYSGVDENLRPVGQEKFLECDTVLLSVGLLPENSLLTGSGVEFDGVTGGAVVDENRQTSVAGIFCAGNVLHVHDLVDNVSEESMLAGRAAALYALKKLPALKAFKTIASDGIRYVLPQKVSGGEGELKLFFRVKNIYKNPRVKVLCGDKELLGKKYAVLAAGEMESLTIDKSKIDGDITVKIER
jgi:NADPH-dependent 2,4-dienoyl-CoA reductase/sulfur reductase-like enzyme